MSCENHDFSNHPFLQQPPFPYNYSLLVVIPSVPRFPALQLSPTPKYVVLLRRTTCNLIEAATFDRKSGEAEGSAVRHSGAPPLCAPGIVSRLPAVLRDSVSHSHALCLPMSMSLLSDPQFLRDLAFPAPIHP